MIKHVLGIFTYKNLKNSPQKKLIAIIFCQLKKILYQMGTWTICEVGYMVRKGPDPQHG